MPSKGIDFYGFVADGFTLEVKAHSAHDTNPFSQELKPAGTWQQLHYEIETAGWGTYYEGRLQFIALRNGQQVFERSLRVNAHTGNIDAVDLANLLIPAVTADGYCFAFGIYNADGAHISDLPNAHQVYASITQDQHDWQHRLFEVYRQQHSGQLTGLTLNQVALPGSHDAGMYNNVFVPSIVNMANTQHETIANQLQLGARYFDFRPGYIEPDFARTIREAPRSGFFGLFLNIGFNVLATALQPFVGQLRHIHLVVPGEPYADFLAAVGQFLQANPEELVVVRIKYDGFKDGAVRRPDRALLETMAASMAQQHGLQMGGVADLKTAVQTLLDAHKRLLVLYDEDSLAHLQSYSDDEDCPETNYQSYEAQHILNALQRVNQGIKPNKAADRVVLADQAWVDAQLQLTATAVTGGAARAIAAAQPATSPLRATKPRTDALTYAWIRDSLMLTEGPLVTLCNDFYDNALTEVTYQANLRRLGLL